MNFAETIFIITIIISIFANMIKIYNIAKTCLWLDGAKTSITSFVFLITHSILWIIAIIEHETLLITQLWKFQMIMFWLHIMFVIVEIMIYTYHHTLKQSLGKGFRDPALDDKNTT